MKRMRVVAGVLLFWCITAAEDPSPEIRFATRVKKLGKPGAAGKLSTSLTLWHEREEIGRARIAIQPAKLDGKGPADYWEIRDIVHIGSKETGRRHASTATLDRRLAARKGVVREGMTNVLLWRRKGDGFELILGRETRTVNVVEDVGVDTAAYAILFARLALGETGRFKTGCLNVGRPERYIGSVEWSFQGPGEWLGRKARLVECKVNEIRIVLAFHAKTREFFGYRQFGDKGSIWALPKGFEPPK